MERWLSLLKRMSERSALLTKFVLPCESGETKKNVGLPEYAGLTFKSLST
jgi:hypothetical protein